MENSPRDDVRNMDARNLLSIIPSLREELARHGPQHGVMIDNSRQYVREAEDARLRSFSQELRDAALDDVAIRMMDCIDHLVD